MAAGFSLEEMREVHYTAEEIGGQARGLTCQEAKAAGFNPKDYLPFLPREPGPLALAWRAHAL